MVYLGELKKSLRRELKEIADKVNANLAFSKKEELLPIIRKKCKELAAQGIYNTYFDMTEYDNQTIDLIIKSLKLEDDFDCRRDDGDVCEDSAKSQIYIFWG